MKPSLRWPGLELALVGLVLGGAALPALLPWARGWPADRFPPHVVIELASDTASVAQLFYDRGDGFSEADSDSVFVHPGPAQPLRFKVRAARVHQFRFDPLTSGGTDSLNRDAIFWHFPGYLGAGAGSWRTTPAGAIRSGDWKLHEFFEDGRLELYNLRDDLGEQHNLAAKLPEKARELHDRLLAWRQDLKAPMPARNTELGQPAKARKGKPQQPKQRPGADE